MDMNGFVKNFVNVILFVPLMSEGTKKQKNFTQMIACHADMRENGLYTFVMIA
jgi:hypothetical protein